MYSVPALFSCGGMASDEKYAPFGGYLPKHLCQVSLQESLKTAASLSSERK